MIKYAYVDMHYFLKSIGILLYILQIASQLYGVLINPGIPNRKYYISVNMLNSIYQYISYTNNDNFDKYQICKICNIYTSEEKEVTHCEDCNICIERIDIIIILYNRFRSSLYMVRQVH